MAATWVSTMGEGMMPASCQQISMSWRAAWDTSTTVRSAISTNKAWQTRPLASRWQCGDRHLDQRWSIAALEGALERCPQLLRSARTFGLGAEALRIAHEVGIGEIARDQPVAVLLLLDAPHIAEGAIVEHDG